MARLAGRKVIVTGASRGMGRRIAAAFVGEGARVALLARASEALESLARELGENALAITCDISDPNAVQRAFAEVEAAFGGLDTLINNAGLAIPGKADSIPDTDISMQVAVNFTGAVYTCRAAIPMLRTSPDPHIVNISSESVKAPYALLAIYAAAKAALENYSASLRKELRKDGIRVTVLRSGYVAGSEMSRNWTDPALQQEFYETCVAWGNMQESGGTPAAPEAMAEALIALLTLPRELNPDMLELRPLAP